MKRVSTGILALVLLIFGVGALNYGLLFFGLKSIEQDASIINQVGVIRGSVQRLAKLELQHIADDESIAHVDHLVATLPHLPESLTNDWYTLKAAIATFRQNPHSAPHQQQLLEASEAAWVSTNAGVYAAQHASEKKLGIFRAIDWVLLLNTLLLLIAIIALKLLVRDRMEKRATFDALTGVFNRSVLDQRAPQMLKESPKLCCLMLDLDHFKKVNDTYGHKAGDSVLKEFAHIVRAHIRKADLLARYGGEEFVLLLSSLTPKEARSLAERIAQAVAGHRFATVGRVTVSIGLACAQKDDTAHALIARADEQLYQAKEAGRNRVTG